MFDRIKRKLPDMAVEERTRPHGEPMNDTKRSLDRRVEWEPSSDISVSPSRTMARADWAIDRYRKLGVSQPPGNRLEESRRFLAQFAGRKAPFDSTDDEFLRRIEECTQTCFEHYLIARSTGPSSGNLPPEIVRKLEESLTGAEVADEEVNSPGRDTQFELFMRALLVMGDVRVWIAEPDLKFLYNGQEVGLAAKRVKRPRKLRQRFNEAVRQIERSGVRGFVGVNADLLVRHLGSEGHAAELGARFEERLKALKRIDEDFVSHPLVIGRLVLGTDTIWDLGKDRPTLEGSRFHDYRVYAKSEEEARAADQFFFPMMSRIRQRLAQLK